MAHYRKIDVSIWNDDRFSSLNSGGKLAYLFLITSPSMTGVGAMRASIVGMADEAGVSTKDFKDVFATGLALFDDKAKCVFVPNFLTYQATVNINPNLVKGWIKQSEFLPECFLKELAIRNVVFFLEGKAPSLREGFDESFLKVNGVSFDEGYGVSLSKGNEVPFEKVAPFLSQRFVDSFRYSVNSKSKPAIEVKEYTHEENANDSQLATKLVQVGGKWHEAATGEEVAA